MGMLWVTLRSMRARRFTDQSKRFALRPQGPAPALCKSRRLNRLLSRKERLCRPAPGPGPG